MKNALRTGEDSHMHGQWRELKVNVNPPTPTNADALQYRGNPRLGCWNVCAIFFPQADAHEQESDKSKKDAETEL